MNLEDLVEAHLAGEQPDVPAELRDEFDRAVAGHEALQYALGETVALSEPGPADRPPPDLPDDYEIVRELGRGGMGVVYLVRQKSLGRLVAVKVLRPGEVTFDRLVKRFLEEARHLARLRHANIVSVHEIGQAANEPYFTMDYVEGEPLSVLLARGRLSPSRALAILKQAAEGVRYAHAQGIIHRDLKPANILLDPQGHAYVTDFGLARDMTQTSKLTRSGEVMGTPAYMAPEQALGESHLIGEATDVHALGVILYEMLTGQPPYGSDAPANVMVRLLKEEPPAPRQLDRRIPRDLETVCLKAMAKTPEQRYASVQAFLEDLRRFEAGEPVRARRPGLLVHAGRIALRFWKPVAALALVAVLVVTLAPRLFDKTVEQLVAVADEQRAAGEYSAAIRVYRRALAKAPVEERRAILDKMLRCCAEINDDKNALEACLLVMETDPDVSFGKYDYLVAQAVVTRIRSQDVNQSIRFANDKNRALLQLARKRLQIFLDGGQGTEAERKEGAETLTVVQKALANEPIAYSSSPDPRPELPEGTPAELLRRAKDPKLGMWERGKAAYAAGLVLEKSGDKAAALDACRQAYDLMRRVYPAYTGMTWAIMSSGPIEDAPECKLLRNVFHAVQRLDPTTPEALRGGLRLRIEGVEIPADLSLSVEVILCDPALKSTAPELSSNHCRRVPFGPGRTAQVGVADGRYRLTVRKSGWAYPGEAARRVGTLLELDGDRLPEVEVRGAYVDVVIPARLAEEIELLEPAKGAAVDLRRDFFRWSAVPGAKHYMVEFGYREDSVNTSTHYGLSSVKVSATSLCLGASPEKEVHQLRERLVAGRTGVWSVSAYDAAGRRVGAVVDGNRPFLVAHGLGEK
jgi:predicted Ser/Thr protein kinase/tetratricopeptide (TPR) repeat protein